MVMTVCSRCKALGGKGLRQIKADCNLYLDQNSTPCNYQTKRKLESALSNPLQLKMGEGANDHILLNISREYNATLQHLAEISLSGFCNYF